MSTKKRFTIYFSGKANKKIENFMKLENCKNKSEWVEKAVNFYAGYLATKEHSEYIGEILRETISKEVAFTEKKLARLLFKVAVELAKIQSLLAGIGEIDDYTLENMHRDCVNEVKKINGIIDTVDKIKEFRDR